MTPISELKTYIFDHDRTADGIATKEIDAAEGLATLEQTANKIFNESLYKIIDISESYKWLKISFRKINICDNLLPYISTHIEDKGFKTFLSYLSVFKDFATSAIPILLLYKLIVIQNALNELNDDKTTNREQKTPLLKTERIRTTITLIKSLLIGLRTLFSYPQLLFDFITTSTLLKINQSIQFFLCLINYRSLSMSLNPIYSRYESLTIEEKEIKDDTDEEKGIKDDTAVLQDDIQKDLTEKLLKKHTIEIRSTQLERWENFLLCCAHAIQIGFTFFAGCVLVNTIASAIFLNFTFARAPLLFLVVSIPSPIGIAIFMVMLFLKMRNKPALYSIKSFLLNLQLNIDYYKTSFSLGSLFILKTINDAISFIVNNAADKLFNKNIDILELPGEYYERAIKSLKKGYESCEERYNKSMENYYKSDLGIKEEDFTNLKKRVKSLNVNKLSKRFSNFLSKHFNITITESDTKSEDKRRHLWSKIKKVLFIDPKDWSFFCEILDRKTEGLKEV